MIGYNSEVNNMSPFDIAVFVFFISVVVKACIDTYHFWFDNTDEE